MTRNWVVGLLAVAATIAVAAAFAVWLQSREEPSAAPSSSSAVPSTPGASTPGSSSTATDGNGMVTGPPELGDSVVEVEHFSSPTGNIGCYMTTEQVDCEIDQHDFELPPEPPDCHGDWVATLEVSTDPGAEPTVGACQTDTALGAEDVLPYGTASVVGDFACLSQETGMTCWNQTTRRGFTVARAGYALF